MTYPTEYRWVGLALPPRTIVEAFALHGTLETPGEADNPTILAWAKEVSKTLAASYTDDSVPWCGLFTAVVVKRAGKDIISGPLWARNWINFGVVAPRAGLGDVLVFERAGGGGHVGFYVAEDESAYHVIGGNQSDQVSVARVAKSRCIAVRRPIYKAQPASVKPYHVSGNGVLSQNEA